MLTGAMLLDKIAPGELVKMTLACVVSSLPIL